jgi:phosphatidylinositol-3,4,5-trisphosphate 5-phosphatase 1
MRLIVFVRKDIVNDITHIEGATESTGIAHVLGNKGGLIVRFQYLDTSFAFVSCHLAAHEGKEHRQQRNDNCVEILQGARVANQNFDIVPQTDHIFWMGDLNYRVDPYDFGMFPKKLDGKGKIIYPASGNEEHQEIWKKLRQMVKDKQYAEIMEHDELKAELVNKRVLVGFQEGDYNFEPTFKVLPGKKAEKRVPRS